MVADGPGSGRLIEVDGGAGSLVAVVRDAVEPRGAPVLLLHPTNVVADAWDAVAAGIGSDRTTIAPDLRGHGRSTANGPFGVDEWLDDVIRVLDAVGVGRVHAVGGSLGGTLALVLARRTPDRVATVTTFGSPLVVEGQVTAFVEMLGERGVRGTFETLVPELSLAPGTAPDVVRRTVDLCNANSREVVAAVLDGASRTDVRDECRGLSDVLPILTVTGSEDRTCPPSQSRGVADILGSAYAELPGVGHLPMLEDPAGATRLMLRQLEAPGVSSAAGPTNEGRS